MERFLEIGFRQGEAVKIFQQAFQIKSGDKKDLLAMNEWSKFMVEVVDENFYLFLL